jgi:ubiquinone/menaquinone biosynthesis C-methylase UbiE
MNTEPHSWVTKRPVTSPFAIPRGIRGRLAGLVMRWTNRQADLLNLLPIGQGQRVLEVGYGPGALIRLLVEGTPAALVQGVDPSPTMQAQAEAANRAGVRTGRVDLRLGSAERTGLPDASVDHVVSVNTVAIWPDLDAGLRELHRVLRVGGTLILAWHGGTRPNVIARSLRLTEEKLNRIESGIRAVFGDCERHRLDRLDVFTATR